jgi:hypothetical protein
VTIVAQLEAEYGDPRAALHYTGVAIRNYHDSGNPTNMRVALATLAVVLDRMGRYEPAATAAGFGFLPFTAAARPELGTAIAHLRDVLGASAYELLARKGEAMSIAEIAAYAYDQIDQALAELDGASK